MCYIDCTKDDVMVGWFRDDPADLTAHLLCDADFAGDPYTLKSTSGCHMDIKRSELTFRKLRCHRYTLV